jgi:hypothetical protein
MTPDATQTTNVETNANTSMFWALADSTRVQMEYIADQRLKWMQNAPLTSVQRVLSQYRFFTIYYISDLALLVHRLPFSRLRSLLAEFLNDELGNSDSELSHPQLYDSFLLSIGVERPAFEACAYRENLTLLDEISALMVSESPERGVGLRGLGGECLCQLYLEAMHSYFSKNPVIQAMADRVDWRFWNIHAGELDISHRVRLREAIDQAIAASPRVEHEICAGYEKSKHAWEEFWSNIFARESVSM